MKRLPIALCLLLVATSAFAFDTTRRGERIAVLRGSHDAEIAMANALRRELRERGFDAFDVEYDDRATIADYVVEIAEARPSTEDYGGIGVSGRHADVEIGIVVSRLHAELRIYDGETMELIASENLSKGKTALMPTSVGIGDGGSLYAVLALPFIERAQHRSVARAAARDAATLVVAAVRGE
ncbi:MAG TPA: hypothetical protein VGQ76_19920 [Thermoanaerobaculia bacterium]|jgi:hypothetical protein|nr:hypothetical protein [Thermoanaerobaculia bacterium]